ncbi:carbohydrate ABC transporter permease [Paenibacillus whitsoniae]|uniref:Sugar ABC transporter permease n=1 Tax=Paenibacillus whitsoniae TaxID=2496558 RepID=A0A3S0CRU2_9BACL|nr:sugar ABC transporter permease [Paenibacillus whitsoniae]RTE06302.1 sugar ABC transporter permease [Paenibacillus whitsoniae]
MNQQSTVANHRTVVKKHRQRINWLPYMLIAPAIILMIVFLFYPVINVFYFSLHKFNPAKAYENGFIGLDNFVEIFTKDKLFYSTLSVTAKWVFIEVFLQLVCGLGIALMLNQSFRFRGFFRSAAILPWAISGVVTSTLWQIIFNEQMGPLNDLLMRIGILDHKVAWLSEITTAFGAIVTAELWRGIPFFTIALLAGLQTIPSDLYESAYVDGAGRWKSFIHITLPYLKTTIILTTLLRAVWEFNNVDLIFVMTNGTGGPIDLTTTLPMYIVKQAIVAQDFGYGSALTVIGFIILLVFAIGYLKLSGYGKEE